MRLWTLAICVTLNPLIAMGVTGAWLATRGHDLKRKEDQRRFAVIEDGVIASGIRIGNAWLATVRLLVHHAAG